MTKSDFINILNGNHKDGDKESTVEFLHDVTKMSVILSTKIVNSLWNCSNPKYFGNNMYDLFENSAKGDEAPDFNPRLKKGCNVYFLFVDEHTAAFVLFKIKEYVIKSNK